MSLQLLIVLISIAAYLIVGVVVGKRVANTADYYVSGRSAPTFLIAGTLFASMLSTNGYTGDTGWAYGGNIVNIAVLNALCGVGFVVGVMLFGRYLRRSETLTMPEYFKNRFNSPALQKISGVIIVISITCYLLAVVTGVGYLLQELVDMPKWLAYVLAWASFSLFTFYAGSKGTIITETMMFIVFIAGTIIAGPYMFRAATEPTGQGGLSHLLENLMNNPEIMNPDGKFAHLLDYTGNFGGAGATGPFGAVMYGIIYGIIWLLVVGISPWQAGRNMMARNEHVAIRSGALACIVIVIFLTYLYLEAISVHAMPHPEWLDADSMSFEKVIIWVYGNASVVPPVLGAIALAGIMAAGLSSAATFLSLIGFSFTNDIFNFKFKDDKDQVRKTRITMISFSVIALLLAYLGFGGIRIVTYFASTIIAASWCIVAFGSVWSKKLTARGAIWSMVTGFVVFIVLKCLHGFGLDGGVFKDFLDPFCVGLYASAAAAVLGSMGQSPTDHERQILKRMHTMPAQEKGQKEYKRDNVYAWILIFGGIGWTCFLLFAWALPYNGFI
ncbi:MAG: sodium:solute symporter family protein [Clostridiales Family XIII bacterium]|jgi:sodium/pantothenate symporter|nr:sodium:solute symporter family protein [Clostridiales Family XIII bacterium]